MYSLIAFSLSDILGAIYTINHIISDSKNIHGTKSFSKANKKSVKVLIVLEIVLWSVAISILLINYIIGIAVNK